MLSAHQEDVSASCCEADKAEQIQFHPLPLRTLQQHASWRASTHDTSCRCTSRRLVHKLHEHDPFGPGPRQTKMLQTPILRCVSVNAYEGWRPLQSSEHPRTRRRLLKEFVEGHDLMRDALLLLEVRNVWMAWAALWIWHIAVVIMSTGLQSTCTNPNSLAKYRQCCLVPNCLKILKAPPGDQRPSGSSCLQRSCRKIREVCVVGSSFCTAARNQDWQPVRKHAELLT